VNQLVPLQFFAVVMVSDRVVNIGPGQLQRATPENKKGFSVALKDARPEGANDDLLAPFQMAFERAFAMKPQLIYFLTDGRFGEGLNRVVGSGTTQQGSKGACQYDRICDRGTVLQGAAGGTCKGEWGFLQVYSGKGPWEVEWRVCRGDPMPREMHLPRDAYAGLSKAPKPGNTSLLTKNDRSRSDGLCV
jgi:hypothetical protein